MTMTDNILQVKNLSVEFKTFTGNVKAVRDVSFDLARGETLAIVGESGSGKSVTSKAIMGILQQNATISQGKISYSDMDLTKISQKQFSNIRGSRMAMVFQDPLSALNPVMKIGKQITESLVLSGKISKKDAPEKAMELMRAVAIPEPEKRYNQYPFQFSGGMRQRIVIACALAGDPELLICDEPTTALDVSVQSQILELIKDLQKERNLSVIFITHDMGVVAGIANRMAVMYAGKIVEIGNVDEVFYNPQHPYTWNLLAAMPDMDTGSDEKLLSIPGTPPNMLHPPVGDAFAARNKFALNIDNRLEPPMFKISDTHYAATWLLHPDAPKVEMPEVLQKRLERQKAKGVDGFGK
ncbi:MAG: ABC transporter ATP-binding protein [Defluviitaleaceae bacterium]|nr:ABC transporter ATP-binding protein [Defluviitaleaceae bacterium]